MPIDGWGSLATQRWPEWIAQAAEADTILIDETQSAESQFLPDTVHER
ncbi:hypothetical protein M4D79_23620 [Mycolicibacterium novocastrense]|nr:hypothetical protein M4D79_23620 [Mycolicibacterium novocastrense]